MARELMALLLLCDGCPVRDRSPVRDRLGHEGWRSGIERRRVMRYGERFRLRGRGRRHSGLRRYGGGTTRPLPDAVAECLLATPVALPPRIALPIPTARLADAFAACVRGAARRAVALSAVTASADPYLDPTASTQEQA